MSVLTPSGPAASAARPVPGADTLTPLVMTAHNWIVLAIGFVTSFVVALVVVEWFLRWVRDHGFVPFAIYRILVGGWVLYLAIRG